MIIFSNLQNFITSMIVAAAPQTLKKKDPTHIQSPVVPPLGADSPDDVILPPDEKSRLEPTRAEKKQKESEFQKRNDRLQKEEINTSVNPENIKKEELIPITPPIFMTHFQLAPWFHLQKSKDRNITEDFSYGFSVSLPFKFEKSKHNPIFKYWTLGIKSEMYTGGIQNFATNDKISTYRDFGTVEVGPLAGITFDIPHKHKNIALELNTQVAYLVSYSYFTNDGLSASTINHSESLSYNTFNYTGLSLQQNILAYFYQTFKIGGFVGLSYTPFFQTRLRVGLEGGLILNEYHVEEELKGSESCCCTKDNPKPQENKEENHP